VESELLNKSLIEGSSLVVDDEQPIMEVHHGTPPSGGTTPLVCSSGRGDRENGAYKDYGLADGVDVNAQE